MSGLLRRVGMFVAGMAAVCVCCRELLAEDRVLGPKLERIRVEVTSTEKDIEKLRSEFASLVKQRKELEGSIIKLRGDDQRIQSKISVLAKESEKLQGKVQVAEARLASEHARNQGRLRALYTGAAPSVSPLFVWKSQGLELERFAVYVRAVRSKDQARFQIIKEAVEDLIHHRQKLRDAIDEGERLQGEVTAKRTEIEQKLVSLQELTTQISSKQRSAQKSLAKLRAEGERLEALMSSITGGQSPDEGLKEEPEKNREVPSVDRDSPSVNEKAAKDDFVRQGADSVRASVALAPQGIFTQGLALVSPVSGKVLQKFGKVKVADFADMIFSKGLEFASPVGSHVHAITNGKVAYVGTMPAYETVVVLDHGARSYSLYGRLGSAAVKKGDSIERDGVVGTTSALDKKGRNFYFEVRKNGAPIDPESVLKRVSR